MKELNDCFSDTMKMSMLSYVQDHYTKHRGWSSETWALEWMYFLDNQNLSEKIDTISHDILVTLFSNLCVPLNDTIMATRIASHLSNKEIIDGAWWKKGVTDFLPKERRLIVQNGMDKIKQDLRENPPFTVMTFTRK
jgi:hypothetical protein